MSKIRVLPSDIETAKVDLACGKSRICHCPVAKALTRRGYKNVKVNGATAIWDNGRKQVTKTLPDSARKFIRLFDTGQNVSTFVFDLD
jgi:hypothetical protein